MSGGALFDSKKRLIGVIVSTLSDKHGEKCSIAYPLFKFASKNLYTGISITELLSRPQRATKFHPMFTHTSESMALLNNE